MSAFRGPKFRFLSQVAKTKIRLTAQNTNGFVAMFKASKKIAPRRVMCVGIFSIQIICVTGLRKTFSLLNLIDHLYKYLIKFKSNLIYFTTQNLLSRTVVNAFSPPGVQCGIKIVSSTINFASVVNFFKLFFCYFFF